MMAGLPSSACMVKAGPEGMAAGGIARKLDTAPNTSSRGQLLILLNAGLVCARREGRSIIYAVDFDRISALLLFLTKDCCGGRPEICAPLAAAVSNACPPRKRRA